MRSSEASLRSSSSGRGSACGTTHTPQMAGFARGRGRAPDDGEQHHPHARRDEKCRAATPVEQPAARPGAAQRGVGHAGAERGRDDGATRGPAPPEPVNARAGTQRPRHTARYTPRGGAIGDSGARGARGGGGAVGVRSAAAVKARRSLNSHGMVALSPSTSCAMTSGLHPPHPPTHHCAAGRLAHGAHSAAFRWSCSGQMAHPWKNSSGWT